MGTKCIPQNEAWLGARPLSLQLHLTLGGLSTRFRNELLKVIRYGRPIYVEYLKICKRSRKKMLFEVKTYVRGRVRKKI